MADICFQGKLAEAVQNHPCLYDFHLKDYSNRDRVQRAWEKVAQELNSSVKECKERWRNMRIVFTRNIKSPPSGAKNKKKPWPHLQAMMFLKPYVTAKGNDLPRNLLPLPSTAVDSSAANNSEEDRDDDVLPSPEEPAEEDDLYYWKKENHPSSSLQNDSKPVNADAVLDYINSKRVVSDNPRKQFLLSLLPDVEVMTVPQFKNFRRGVLHLIDQIDEPAWTHQESAISPISTQSWSGESSQSSSNQHLHPHNYITK
ncbi:uncharacterized protein LOC128984586 [Macrosteles quadrilineatus]|uniref:uncharacterized protein LOC128984586 n=1 Tax=Macrosteles quadrilineatus TaxID=74068 RepID=UPI0023E316FD|nr:uncharacterized protein LOC128984586 [Macrosteles quadrilineatus]